MDIEEANKVLEELSKDVRPEMLNDKANRLFNAIMKIADERDEIKSDLYEANNRIVDLMDIIDERDKLINFILEDIHRRSIDCVISTEELLQEYKEKFKKVEGK